MAKEDSTPFGLNETKRYVSSGGEDELYHEHVVDNHGTVTLVDYMGGDDIVERVATAGHGRGIFTERPSQEQLFNNLTYRGIKEPFQFVQLKLSMQMPIEAALAFVYDPSVDVNEYSGRYSEMLGSSMIPDTDKLAKEVFLSRGEEKDPLEAYELAAERAEKIVEIIREGRKTDYRNYMELVEGLDMTRELARSGLGTDNDTRFFWKISIPDLVNFYNRWSKMDSPSVLSYLDNVMQIAKSVAPGSLLALMNPNERIGRMRLTMPTDDEIVDPDLSPAQWSPQITKRVTVPALEEILFVNQLVLDHGGFQAIDYMGNDDSLAEAARTSYGEGTEKRNENKTLVDSLIRDKHTSPIEMAELAIETKAPVFTDPRQFSRHRTAPSHGFMGYHPIGSQFYFPAESEFKYQDRKNRQGRGKEMDQEDKEMAQAILRNTLESQTERVQRLRELGAPENTVRDVKGVGFYTKMSRTSDTHNFGHLLSLRNHSHAQKEIQEYAKKLDDAHQRHTPVANAALHNYLMEGMNLSREDIEIMREMEAFNSDFDSDNLENYKGHGWISRDEKGNRIWGKSRQGPAFQAKIKRLRGE